MITNPEYLRRFEEQLASDPKVVTNYHKALKIYEGLWEEALFFKCISHKDYLVDIKPDIKIAKTLNMLKSKKGA